MSDSPVEASPGSVPGIVDEQIKVYQANFIEHGDSPKGTHQNNSETQNLRFEMITGHLLEAGTRHSIEDIGCGICDLYGYLKTRPVKFDYSGTEIVPEMIELARRKYPGITVRNRDVFAGDLAETHDFVVLSGTLNMPGNISPDDWERFCFQLIRRMYAMCTKAISFNFLTTHGTFRDPTLFYLDPARVVDYCLSTLSRFVELKHNYALYEGTVTVYRKSFIEAKHRGPAFAKYFR